MTLLDRICAWRLTLVWCLVFQLGSTIVYGAPPVTEETLTQRRNSIASLPEAQRQELARKYDQYQKLTAEERAKLQELHDVTEAAPDLKQVMDNYCEWLKNLDVTQREQLRQAKTPEQKRNLVVKFHQAQVKGREDAWREATPPQPAIHPLPLLSSEELKSVMTTLEAELVKASILDPKVQAELAKSEGSQHYKLLMRAIAEYRHPEKGDPREFAIPEQVRIAIGQVVKNADVRKKITESGRGGDRFRGQFMIFGMLAKSTTEEVRREFNGRDANQIKEAIFNSWPEERQARFSQAPPMQRDNLLMRTHLEEIWRAFIMAGDLPVPRPPGDGKARGRGGDYPPPYKNGEANRNPRPMPGRKPDQPEEPRRKPKTE
ncbi:MAG: hypothetical protein JWN70_7102 [Planctomycetaceae bacterium]|nr:hypothetical protein [Planctomycetaceae bacterium]